MKTIVVGADHAGFKLKEQIKDFLKKWGYRVEDVGAYKMILSDDYPEYAEKVALKVVAKRGGRGILACGTGIGASIVANKIPGIRAALVGSMKDARLSREHNDANLLVLGGWENNKDQISKIVQAWLEGKFQGGRHRRRVNQIIRIEKKYTKQHLVKKR